LRFLGGGALSDVWCQIMADVLGCPVAQIADPRNANAVGSSFTAFAALGQMQVEEMASLVKVANVFQPTEANRRAYDQQFGEFMAAFKQLKPIYRRLSARRAAWPKEST
jgi:xylulokinase